MSKEVIVSRLRHSKIGRQRLKEGLKESLKTRATRKDDEMWIYLGKVHFVAPMPSSSGIE